MSAAVSAPTVLPCTMSWQGRIHDGTLAVLPGNMTRTSWYAVVAVTARCHVFLTEDGWHQLPSAHGTRIAPFDTVDDALAAVAETGEVALEDQQLELAVGS